MQQIQKKLYNLFKIERPSNSNNLIHYLGRKQALQRYKFVLKYCKEKKVLDLGSGFGYGSDYLAKEGVRKIVLFDNDFEVIRYINNKHSLRNLEVIKGDCLHLPFSNNSFDTIICSGLIAHVKHPKLLLREIERVLRKDGILIIATINKTVTEFVFGSHGTPFHYQDFSTEELKQLVQRRFEVLGVLKQMPLLKKPKWLTALYLFISLIQYKKVVPETRNLSGLNNIIVCKNR